MYVKHHIHGGRGRDTTPSPETDTVIIIITIINKWQGGLVVEYSIWKPKDLGVIPDQNCIFKQYVVAHCNLCVRSMTLPKNSQPFINLFYYYFCVVALHQDWLPETIISWNSICVCVFFLNWILFFDLCLCVCVCMWRGGGAVTYFLLLCAWSSQSQRLCFSNVQEFFLLVSYTIVSQISLSIRMGGSDPFMDLNIESPPCLGEAVGSRQPAPPNSAHILLLLFF